MTIRFVFPLIVQKINSTFRAGLSFRSWRYGRANVEFILKYFHKTIMSKYIFYLALQIFSMDGMYIQINQVKNGFVSYIDFHFIDIDLDAEQCAFYSRDGGK